MRAAPGIAAGPVSGSDRISAPAPPAVTAKASGGDLGWHKIESPELDDKAINDAVDIPIVIYNIPGRTGSRISPEISMTGRCGWRAIPAGI